MIFKALKLFVHVEKTKLFILLVYADILVKCVINFSFVHAREDESRE